MFASQEHSHSSEGSYQIKMNNDESVHMLPSKGHVAKPPCYSNTKSPNKEKNCNLGASGYTPYKDFPRVTENELCKYTDNYCDWN